MDGKIMIFLHIPKTAGNSVFNIIRRQYPAHRRYELDMDWDRRQETIDNFIALDEERKRQITYVGGHIFYGFHRFTPQQAVYMTFMRDPVDRFISHYYFIKQSPFDPLMKKLEQLRDPNRYQQRTLEFLRLTANRRSSLEEFLDLSIDLDVMDLQTRIIGGFVDPADETPPFQELPPNALPVALDNIQRDIPVVGLVEHFDASLLLFRKAFGWRNIFYARHNPTRSRPALSQVPSLLRDKIEKASPLDMELYRRMSERLQEQIFQYGDSFPRQLATFKAGTRCYSFLQKCYQASGLKRLRHSFR